MRTLTFSLILLAAGATRAAAQTATDIPEPADYRSRTIYFLLADRFHAHQPFSPYVDPEHPFATNRLNCFVQDCDREPQFRRYWGGDIDGLIQKLDYLKNLGISALWVTPLMENVRAYGPGTGYGTGYHGYWVQNYYQVNAHFGNWQKVQELSEQLHARGMRYIQDITLNHSNPYDNHVYGRLYESTSNQIFIRSYQNDFDPANGLRYYKHFQNDSRCTCPSDQQCAENLPDYQWSYWQLHHCLLADLSGYDQRTPAMADYLLGAGKTWIDHGVDDYRLDAVKFPFPEFIANFTRTMREHLASLGRPVPYFVGEWSNGGVGDAKSIAFQNNYNYFGTNILDFQLSFALNQFIGGAYEDPSQLLNGYGLDNLLHVRVETFDGRDSWMGTFLDNHDQIRTMVRLDKLKVADESERKQRMDLGTVLLMTVRGIPIIYYGDEQYLAHYNDNQTTDPKYVNNGNDDPWNRPGLNSFSEDTAAFRIIRTLARLRRESPAVSQGKYITAYVNNDVIMFERVEKNEIVLVAVNRGESTTITQNGTIGLPPDFYSGLLEDATPVNQGNYLSVAGRSWTLHLNKLSSLVLHVTN